jgi:hypothetical protein
MQEWLRDKSLNVLEWHSQSPDLNSIEQPWTELERTCREEWGKLLKYRCAKLITTKGASIKY